MIFNENSTIVQAWVKQIKSSTYARKDIPNLGNLIEVVNSILNKEGK